MDGYCPVTLTTRSNWKRGDAQYRETYEGLTYYFVGEQEREAFVQDPAKYCLAASGTDVVTLKTSGQTEPGLRRFGFRYEGQTFLFSSSATMRQFAGAPQEFASFASTLSGRH
jgi:YHS domain-containing protein